MQIEQIKPASSQMSPKTSPTIAAVASSVALNSDPEKATEEKEDMAEIAKTAADLAEGLNIIHNVDLQFHVHKRSGKVIVTVTDEETGEVIREIPHKEMLDLAAKMDEMIGLIFDQRS